MRNIFILLLLLCGVRSVTAQAITIDKLSKTTSYSGDKITISGSGFSDTSDNLKVSFGATLGHILSSTDDQIEVSVPPGATYGPITLSNQTTGLSASSNTDFLLAFGGKEFDPTKKMSALTDFGTGDGLYDLCLCDFNNDKKTDIATSNEKSDRITVLSNSRNARGKVQFTTSSHRVNSKTRNIQCADLDNDGKPEIILSKAGAISNAVMYMKNISTGTDILFNLPKPLTIDEPLARRIEVADLDLDGKPEIIVSNRSNNRVTIFQNTSTFSRLSFNRISPVLVKGMPTGTGLRVKDLNNDKYPDIAITAFLSSANVYILENEGSLKAIKFKPATSFLVPGASIANIDMGDFNNDQKPDIVVTDASNSNKISILKNTSANGGTITFAPGKNFITAKRPWGIGLGDLNGDGKLDLAISSVIESVLSVFINTSTGDTFSFGEHDINTLEKSRNIKVGDIDGNGRPDLIFTSVAPINKVSVIKNEHCLVPTIFGDDNRTLCTGNKLELNTSGGPGVTCTWYKNDGTGEKEVKTSGEPFYIETLIEGAFTYKAKTSEGGICTKDSPQVKVNVINGAISKVTGITDIPPVCEGKDFKLNAQGNFPLGATFEWTKPDNSTQTTGNPNLKITNATKNHTGKYQVKVRNGPCVSDLVSTSVQIVPVSGVTIASSEGLRFCVGQSTTLSVPRVNTSKYQWYKDNKKIPSGGNTSQLNLKDGGKYHVKISTAQGCDIQPDVVTIDVYKKPVAKFAKIDQACRGQKTSFTNTSIYRKDISTTFSWDFGDKNTSKDENPAHTYSSEETLKVTLTVSHDAHCKAVYEQNITIREADNINISANGPTTICEGEKVVLAAPEGFRKYLWNDTDAGTTSSITVTKSETYQVSATNNNGCISIAEKTVKVLAAPTITIDIQTTSLGETRLLASGGERYEWTPNPTLSGNDLPNPVVSPEITTAYQVTGYDSEECSNTAEITVKVKINDMADKVFTPNQDGENDTWIIKNVGQFSDCTLFIFSRNGQVVFEKKNYTNDWDGTFKGKNLQEGVYYYIIKCDADNDNSLTGSITILR